MINRELEACTAGPSRARAIGRNHNLWSLLVKDLSLADNMLPEPVKAQLIGIGLWSMRYSTLALLRELPVDPLIAVNSNVLDGLTAQAARNGAEQRPTSPFQA